jgi:hypothetical protein
MGTSMRSRHEKPFDVLSRELVKLREVSDAFTIEGVGTFLFDVLDRRGPGEADAFEAFCRGVVDDGRAVTSVLGVQALALVADLGHPAVRPAARAAQDAADEGLRSGLPSWVAQIGHVHVVEAGALRTADGAETVLHVLLDYDAQDAGARHLMTVAMEHGPRRVHVLDVRGRDPHDTLVPMAELYAASEDPLWSWIDAGEIADLVEDAVRETSRHSDEAWPVVDVEGTRSVAWTLGVRRLEQVGGRALR